MATELIIFIFIFGVIIVTFTIYGLYSHFEESGKHSKKKESKLTYRTNEEFVDYP